MANEATAPPAATYSDACSAVSELSTETFREGVKADLLSALSSIESLGSFASFRALGKPPDSGLIVDGVGPISTSSNMHETQVQQLIAKARQAPFGRGSDTIVDTSVRNTWELDPNHFRFSSPRWDDYIQELCAQVALDLGINTTVRHEIYKMLIYEKGAMFKPHTEYKPAATFYTRAVFSDTCSTEKIPGMFGTLVVSLPSPHTGGEVVLKHRGEKKVFKTSEAEHSCICWYSDVTHEILPITSGYRWVLTYNLAIDTTDVPRSAQLLDTNIRWLRHTIRRWILDEPTSREHQALYHILDHDYTQANIRLSSLKARDLAQVRALQEASNTIPFEIFLALLEKEESGTVEDNFYYGRYHSRYYGDDEDDEDEYEGFHHISEILEEHYTIKTLVDLDGRIISQHMPFEEDDILEENCFADLEGEEEYEGYMGNSGPQATHWYRKAAVVIVPKESITSFLNCDQPSELSHDNVQSLICYWAHRAQSTQSLSDDVAVVERICDEIWKRYKTSHGSMYYLSRQPFEGETMDELLKATIHLQRYDLFERNASRHEGMLNLDFYTWVAKWSSIHTGDGMDIAQRFTPIKKGLSASILHLKSLSTQLIAMLNITSQPLPNGSQPSEVVHSWACETLKVCLEDRLLKPLASTDGTALCEILFFFEKPLEFFLTSIAPKIENRCDAPGFSLEFLSAFRKKINLEHTSSEQGISTYKHVAKLFISSADFPALSPESGESYNTSRLPRPYYDRPYVSEQQSIVSVDQLLGFLSDILDLGLDGDPLMTSFSRRFVEQASQLSSSSFILWNPVFRDLVLLLVKHGVSLDNPTYQRLFLTFFNAFLDNYVRRQPPKNTSLIRPRVSCSCSDCGSLNSFLSNSTQRVGRFGVNKKRRQHIHQQLDSQRIDCTHETDRVGSPQTLVVTKTNKFITQARSKWKVRFEGARQALSEFDQSHLIQLLGHDYTKITKMKHLISDPQTESSLSTVPVWGEGLDVPPKSNRSQQVKVQPTSTSIPTAGIKRKNPSTD